MTQPFHQENSARSPLCKPWETVFLTGSQSWWPTRPKDEGTTWNKKVNLRKIYANYNSYLQNFNYSCSPFPSSVQGRSPVDVPAPGLQQRRPLVPAGALRPGARPERGLSEAVPAAVRHGPRHQRLAHGMVPVLPEDRKAVRGRQTQDNPGIVR